MFLSRQHFITFVPSSPAPTGNLTRDRRAVPDSPMKILIDNGHGIQIKGKRSPNGILLEYAYTRELARQIVMIFKSRGYDSELLVPEDDDIPLSERVRRVNEICLTYEPSCPAPTEHPNVILISLHLNAAGDGTKWMNATGWSCYTCKGQTESDRLADCLYKSARCFVFPSLSEGFGLPVLEAMAAGCPVALSRRSCFPEVAGDAALYFNPDDEYDMCRVVSQAVEDEPLRERLVALGRLRASLFTWQRSADEHLALYKQLLQ